MLKPIKRFIFAPLIFIMLISAGTSYGQQQRVYADAETHGATTLSSVSSPTSAIDMNLQTYSTLNVVVLGTAWQQFKFSGTDQPTSTTPVRIKVGTAASLLTLLASATVQAYNNTTAVGSAQGISSLITLLDGGNQYEIVFTPNVAYNGVRITFGGVSLGGNLNIYEAYFYKSFSNVDCDIPADELHGTNAQGNVFFTGSVTNPLNAIDASSGTYAVMNASTGTAAYTNETVLLPGLSVLGDSVRLTVSTTASLVPSQVISSLSVITYNDNTSNNDASANAVLLNIRLQSSTQAIISFAPAAVFNRVEVRLGGATSVLSSINLHEVQRIIPAPVLSITNRTICTGNTASLTGTVPAGTQIQWYSASSGGTLLTTGTSYTTPVLTSSTNYYPTAMRTGCTNTSDRLPDTVIITGITAVTPGARCGSGVVSIVATNTGGVSWYTASTGGSALATGTTYSPSLSSTTSYYAASNASQCASAPRLLVTATVNSFSWAGTTTTDWSTLANWDCGSTPPMALPGSLNDITIPTTPSGGRFPTISTTALVNNITIASAASITVASGGVFEIYGAISNSGTFTATSGTISMRGSSQQTIPANAFSTNTIKNLTINNSSGVSLAGDLNLTGTLTPTAGLLTTNDYLTLKSDITNTARVAAGTGTYITGKVNVERYIPAKRSWRLMTGPVTNSNTIFQSWQNNGVYAPGKGMLVTAPGGGTGIDSSGNASLKSWNVWSQGLQTVFNTKVPISSLNTGVADNTGYFVFIRGDRDPANIDHSLIKKNVTTLTVKGSLQTGTQNFTGLSAIASGYSLIGNPYASYIDMNQVFANSGTFNLKRKFYVWDPKFNSVGGYVALDDVITPGVFAPSPVTSSQGNYIQSGQAFFIVTNAAGSAGLEIKEANKNGSNNTAIFGRPFGNTESFITNLFLMDIRDSSVSIADGTRADFNESFSAAVDDIDNLKFYNVNETFGLMRNNVFLATERRPAIVNRDTLFFRLAKTTQRAYQFQFQPVNFDDIPMVATLEDRYTGIFTPVNLTGITKVNFIINADSVSQAPDRFRVVFTGLVPLPVSFASVQGFRQNTDIRIVWKVDNQSGISLYEVERSVDGTSFIKINTTAITAGNSAGAEYSYLDEHALKGDNFYRIRYLGQDGNFRYSLVVKVSMDRAGGDISVYPNPVAGKKINLQFKDQPAGHYTIALLNASGQLLLTKRINHIGGSDTKNILVPGNIRAGNYRLSVTGDQLKKTVIKIFIP